MRRGVRLCITGSEVMNGFVLDRNTQFFASELYALGLELVESRILHDDKEQILKTWREFSETGDIIVNSGGLGPTSDDLTVDLLCEWLGDQPIYEPHAEKRTRYFFERRARDKTRAISVEVALRQARIPSRAQAIRNTVGLAPGIFIPEQRFIALPGFPDEIRGMWQETLDKISSLGLQRSATRIIPVWGVGESQLFTGLEVPEGVSVGVHALPWGCRLFLRDAGAGESILNAAAEAVGARYPAQVSEDPLREVIEYCSANSLTLSLAESCTGGLAAKQVTDVAGVSAIFKGGAVTYANEAKQNLLKVQANLIEEFGAVSAECARAMAAGAAQLFDAKLSLAFTGIAGPDGGSAAKPVGTVFIALHDARSAETRVGKFMFPFGRDRFRAATVACGFLALRQYLMAAEKKPWPLAEFI
ncbi:MAG: nicotinamide-nucleotide amidohydrolase family protein [Leptospiraceae bacterium]|nr:nicotinamide-nucleotide amidohydrolase family protein [Leptospiraceae bacterium]